MKDLKKDDKVKTIKIDAYVSPQVPAEYAAHKLNLLSTLTELSSLSGGKIVVDVHEIENFSQEATNAEKAYGIEPHEVHTIDRGARKTDEIYLGAAFSSGLDRVVLPFIDKGIPVEYELVRSICTVSQQKRRKLGVLKTDAQLFGGFSMQGQTEESQLVAELKKQYDVVEVDPSKPILDPKKPIKDQYDVLLAVQPSSLNPPAMKNFIAAVKAGLPTAVFEDPYPWPQLWPEVVGTAQPKKPPGGMMGMFGGGQQPEPKGDISELWKLLGVEMYGDEIVWQDFNPEPKLGEIYKEWIFVDESLGDQKSDKAVNPFDPDDPISAGMKQVLFFWPGSFRPADGSKMHFQKLAVTGRDSGTIGFQEVDMSLRSGNTMGVRRVSTHEPYIIATHVTGNVSDESGHHLTSKDDKDAKDSKGADAAKSDAAKDAKAADAKADDGKEKSADKADKKGAEDDALAGKAPEKTKIDVVLVADIDWIAPIIFRLREMGQDPDSVIDFKFQNVAFVLNILDSLAKDDRFIDLRKRTRSHRILTKIEEATEEQRKDSLEEQSKFVSDARQQIDAAQDEYRKKMADLEKREDLDPRVKEQMMDRERIRLERMRDVNIAHAEKERNKQVKQSERELASKIRGVQDRYKLLAVLLPPIPPIVLAFFVFFNRRKAEQEGVDTRRLRFGKGKEPAA